MAVSALATAQVHTLSTYLLRKEAVASLNKSVLEKTHAVWVSQFR